jgi:hypothetical protein
LLYLAMAHWHLEKKEMARQCYAAAARFMERHPEQWTKDWRADELRFLRNQAAALLGVTENDPEK